MKKQLTQAFSLAFIIILVINLVLFALNKISALMLWTIIILAAITAYFILPKIK